MVDINYRRLFDAIPCYVSVQDKDFHVIASNKLFEKAFGGKKGAFCYQVYKGRSDKCPVCPVEKTFQDGKVHSSEEVVKLETGEDVNVIVYAAPIKNEAGEIEAVIEISTDITGIKQLQQKFFTLFEEVPCYISVQDRNLVITDANRQFKTDFGEGVGQHCYKVYKHRAEPCLVCPVATTFQTGEISQSEEVVTAKDGKQVNVLCQAAAIRNAVGEIAQVMEISTNISEVRQLQSQLTSLGLMVSSVSHGIKGLLSGLDGGVYLMETGFKKDNMDRVKQGWEMMQRNVDGIRSMVLNVLYYAKEREVYWQDIDLLEITDAVGSVLSRRAQMFDISLEVKAQDGTFEGDRHSINSMLVNLGENSIDACRLDKKEVDHLVKIESRIEDDQVVFEVSDNGTGMDQETKEKAFSLFFSSKGAEGTGLGLFIANKIAGNHFGTIEIETTEDVGTKFIIRLPVDKPS
jgi:signal transduction histidine kinase